MNRLLVINPGSTSTKIAVFDDLNVVFEKTLRHSTEEINSYKSIYDQKDFRKDVIAEAVKENNVDIASIDAFVGRGGLLKPIPGGTYEVNEAMCKDLKSEQYGAHASNLGALICNELAKSYKKKAYIADPVVVDELEDVARYSGLKGFDRLSIFHALNQKAIAKRYAKGINKKYTDINVVVAHLGGGISVGAHKNGKVIDVNNALDGEGPFSPERTGTIPVGATYKAAFSGKYTIDQMKKMNVGQGGMVSYLNTNSGMELANRMKAGDKEAINVCNAMCYQISKAIGEYSVVLKGNVDAILITGGLAYNEDITSYIKEYTSFIAPVEIFPGEDELVALAENVLAVINKQETVKVYK